MNDQSNLRGSMNVIKAMFGIFTVAMLVLIGGLYIDGRDRDDAIDAVEDALAQFEADRIDRSVNACEDRNAIRIGMNRLALSAFGHDPETGQPTAAFAAATPTQQQTARDRLQNLIPLQVCSPDAIQVYIDSNRSEGLVPIDGTDGYSEAVTPP